MLLLVRTISMLKMSMTPSVPELIDKPSDTIYFSATEVLLNYQAVYAMRSFNDTA